MEVFGADDKFFYTRNPQGKETRIAKRGLKPGRISFYQSKLDEYEAARPSAPVQTIGQTEAPITAPDPAFDLVGSPARITDPTQLNLAPAQSVAQKPSGFVPQIVEPEQPEQELMQQVPMGQGMIPATQTVTEQYTPGAPIDPQAKSLLLKSIDDEAQIAKQQIKAQAEFGEAYLKESQKLDAQIQKVDAQYEEIEQARQQAIQGVEQDYRQLVDQLVEAKIDPNRFYGDSIGKRVMAGIAIGIGAIGRALTGSSNNTALKIIDDAINRDIAAQEQGIKQLGERITIQRQLMSDIDAKYDDKITANNLKKSVLLDAAMRKVDQLKSGLTNEQSILQAESLLASLQAKKAEFLNNAAQQEAGKVTRTTVTQMLSPESLKGKKKELSGEEKKRADNVRMGINALRDMIDAYGKGVSTVKLIGDNDYTAARARFIEAIGRMQSGGAITKDEWENFKNLAATWQDDKKMGFKKLENMLEEFKERGKTLEMDPDFLFKEQKEEQDKRRKEQLKSKSATFQPAGGR